MECCTDRIQDICQLWLFSLRLFSTHFPPDFWRKVAAGDGISLGQGIAIGYILETNKGKSGYILE